MQYVIQVTNPNDSANGECEVFASLTDLVNDIWEYGNFGPRDFIVTNSDGQDVTSEVADYVFDEVTEYAAEHNVNPPILAWVTQNQSPPDRRSFAECNPFYAKQLGMEASRDAAWAAQSAKFKEIVS